MQEPSGVFFSGIHCVALYSYFFLSLFFAIPAWLCLLVEYDRVDALTEFKSMPLSYIPT